MAEIQKREIWKANLYTLWFTQLLVNMGFGLVMPFIPYYFMQMQPLTDVQLNYYTGLASSLASASMAIASPFWGKISDIYGRKAMLIRAMVCGAIVLCLMGLAKAVWVFIALRVLQGIFTGTIPAAMALVSSHTPEDKMSYALGFMTSSNFLGFALGPVIGSPIIELFGYSACFFSGGALLFIGTLFVVFLVKEDPNTYGRALKMQQMEKEHEEAAKAGGKKKLGAGFLTVSMLMMMVALFLVRMGRMLFSPFTAIYVRDTLGTMDGATIYTGIINTATCASTAISAVTLTRLGDRYDKFKYSLVLAVIAMVIGIGLPLPFPLWAFIIVYAVYYFVVGAIEPVLTSALSEQVSPAQRGSLFGLTSTVNCISMMVSPMLAASITTAFSTRAILVCMPICMLVLVLFLLVQVIVKGKKAAY